MRVFIFYHNDADGHLSAAIAQHFLREVEKMAEEIVMHEITYGDPFPDEEIRPQDLVFMLDYSLQPLIDMSNLADSCHLYWIDHHATSISEEENITRIKGIRKLGRSAAELTWEYFYHDLPPKFVELVGAYDTWRVRENWDSEVLPFHYFLEAQETDPSNPLGKYFWQNQIAIQEFEEYSKEVLQKYIMAGHEIYNYVSRSNDRLLKSKSYAVKWEGLKWLAYNGLMFNEARDSEEFQKANYDGVLSYFNVKGQYWVVSMRTDNPKIHLGELAKKYGGGGHKGAAGFQTTALPGELVSCMDGED